MKPSYQRRLSGLPSDFDPYTPEQREERLEKARNDLEAARNGDPNYHFDIALNGVLLQLNKLGRHEEVLEFMPDISDIRLNISQKSLMAQSMMALGQIEKAIEFLEHCTANDPDEINLQVRLAEAYIAAGRLKEANNARQQIKELDLSIDSRLAKSYEDFIRKDPTDPEHHCSLAECRANLSDYKGAVEAMEAAIALDPEDQDYREMLEEYKGKISGCRN